MFYTIYQITNLINNKIYIGLHRTKNLDDDYMGSGKRIKCAIKKYGLENFKKEILFVFDNEKDMIDKEIELVTEEFCLREDTYNMAKGGGDGWAYANRNGLSGLNSENIIRGGKTSAAILHSRRKTDKKFDEFLRNKISKTLKDKHKKKLLRNVSGDNNPFFSKEHSKEHKEKLSIIMKEKQSRERNSQYGTVWITNGAENRKIKKNDNLPEGWQKGRIQKKK